MASDVKVRVLQSGKVYRQMFDAEVQLVKSLQINASKRQATKILSVDTLPPLKTNFNKSITGVLTERQKTWTQGMPNDSITENPVHYRQTTTEISAKLQETEKDIEARNVRGLPEVVRSSKGNSNISERILEKRNQKHNNAVEEMHIELSAVSNNIEPKISELGESLMQNLKQNDVVIEKIFEPIMTNEELIHFGFEQLEDIWKSIESQAQLRQEWINETNNEYQNLENLRISSISEIFRKYAALLGSIAFLLPQDVERFISKEAMMVNQSILANRRAFTKLHINLLENDIQREMIQRLTWQEKVQDWKALNAEVAVKQFQDFMASNAVVHPSEIELIIENHMKDQNEASNKRLEILNQLERFKPPSSTKTSVYKWNSALAKANENIDDLHLKLIRAINAKYESVCQMCLTEIDKYRKNLVLSNVCTEEDIQRIVNDHMLPLVGAEQRKFENDLEKLDQAIEAYALRCEVQLKNLFKFAQGAAHLWDVHEIGLAKQERKLQSTLDQVRQQHDLENQERESKLDIIMDRLRQESNEESLASCLQRSLEMLEVIFEGYQEFHEEQLKHVKEYPSCIEEELSRYDNAMCNFFSVDRNKPKPIYPIKVKVTKPHSDSSYTRSWRRRGSMFENKSRRRSSASIFEAKQRRNSLSIRLLSAERKKESNEKSSSDTSTVSAAISDGSSENQTTKILRDTLITEKGTYFYVMTVANKEDFEDDKDDDRPHSTENIFMTEVSEMNPMLKPIVEEVCMQDSFFRNIKKKIRMSFLNHLELWKERSMTVAQVWRRDKLEELESELDLRLHLHAPRAKRIELDVHNVRAAELVLHKERVSRHCKGITAALVGLKDEFDEVTKEHDNLALDFKGGIESMENIFINATKSTKLVELTESLHNELDDYMSGIKASLRNFRQKLDATLSRLRDSNAQCLKSFKLFSQGGNFSPDETIGLRKKLEKMSHKVDVAEGVIMQDLEGMESKRLDQATEVITKFEDRFRNHMVDLIFMEKIQRWITNSQVRIKTEVAYCNGEAAQLAAHVKTVESRIDACKHPNIDKETVTTELLQTYLLDVMAAFHTRAEYLNCKKKLATPTPAPAVAAATSRVSVSEPSLSNMVPLPSSRQKSQGASRKSAPKEIAGQVSLSRSDVQAGGRRGGPQEDVAIGMIKNILKTQKRSNSYDFDDLQSGTRQVPSTSNSQMGMSSRMQKGTFTRQSTIPSIAGSSSSDSDRVKKTAERSGSSLYKRRETKFDQKFMVFGNFALKESHFNAKVQVILFETLDGLLSAGEVYYKQKGARAPTRPKHIQENFDSFGETVTSKLLNYQQQTDEFLNTSLQEFRQQLKTVEEHVAEIPVIVLEEVQNNWLEDLHKVQKKLNIQFGKKEENWNKLKTSHKDALRPTMGHPNRESTMQTLTTDEENRMNSHVSGIKEHSCLLQERMISCVNKFTEDIYSTSQKLLLQLDNFLTIDDVLTGRIPMKRERTSVLLRQKAAGKDLLNTSYTASLPRGPNTWPGLNMDIFNIENISSKVNESVATTQTTLAHTSTVNTRDLLVQSFADTYLKMKQTILEQENSRLLSEERWAENWKQSVEHVRNLYI